MIRARRRAQFALVAWGLLWSLAAGCSSESPSEPAKTADPPAEAAAAAEPSPPPNILLVTIDTQRADSFGIYGNPGGHTPNIDRLAEEGTVFERATAPIGTTFPSHASLLTGLYPRRHGVRYNGDTLADEFQTATEIMREAGWDTMGLVTYGSMVSRGGLGQGFLRTSHEKTGKHSLNASPLRVTTMARGLLKRRRPHPFFMWVHYFHPHSPYELSPYAEEKLAGYEGSLKDGATTQEFYGLAKREWSDQDRAALRALYDGETREADRLVGEILETLEKTGHAERTIVIITADHGQLLGEHGDVGHGFRLWEPVLHVPLVIYDPKRPEARRVSTRVGLVDVGPTLLELVGLPVPDGLDGRSLVPFLRGESMKERPYFSEVRSIAGRKKRREQMKDKDELAIAVYLDDRKLIVQDGEPRLYDLTADPEELVPILAESDDPRARELAELAAIFRRQNAPTKGQVAPVDLAPGVAEELRALGYLE